MSENRRNYEVSQPIPTKNLARTILRWVARVLSIVSIGILLLFLIGEGMADGFSTASIASITWREWVAIVFFPLGVVVGMVVGWFRDGVGGSITAISLLLFYALDVLFTGTPPSGIWFAVFASPGLLFLVCAFLSSRSGARAQRTNIFLYLMYANVVLYDAQATPPMSRGHIHQMLHRE